MSEETFTPYRIDVPQRDLDDLHERLDRTRWPEELPGVGWSYGVPLGYLRELVDYWRHDYDWRAAERRLNAWPQSTTVVDGATVHVVHVRSPEPDATPLVLTHGWPGSIVEFTDVVGPLTDPRAHGGDPADAFHVVLPTIPGFGLSGPTTETGWHQRRVAGAVAEVMQRLGYDRYGAHGGDWGSTVTRELARLHPERMIGMHLTMVIGAHLTTEPTEAELADLDPAERERALASWRRNQWWQREGVGYNVLQASRPQTLAYALTDSPVGQLAWVVEKFFEWTDSTDRPEDAVDRDLLLTDVMLYWLTGTAGSSARLYYERAHSDRPGAPLEPGVVPTGVADFPAEIYLPLRSRAEQQENIVRWTSFEHGGHFAALEQPTALVEDVRAFFRDLRTDR